MSGVDTHRRRREAIFASMRTGRRRHARPASNPWTVAAFVVLLGLFALVAAAP